MFRSPFRIWPLLVAVLCFPVWSSATLLLHSTLDNMDVGAGAGTDTTQSGGFEVRDTAGSPTHGSARDVLNLGATASAHVTAGASGQIGEALQFPSSSASNRGVTYGDVNNIGIGDYTVSLWFNALDTVGTESLASKGNVGSGDEGWHVFVENGMLHTRLGLGGSGALQRASMSQAGSSAAWHHVAMVVDDSTGVLSGYLDGALMTTAGGGGPSDNLFTPGSNVETTDPLHLGVSGAGSLEFMGSLDDVAILDEALSASAISALYQGGLNGMNAHEILIPEPSSLGLFLLGFLLLARQRAK